MQTWATRHGEMQTRPTRPTLRRKIAGDVQNQLVRFEAKASMEPLLVGTIAMFEVTNPSTAFSVETAGC